MRRLLLSGLLGIWPCAASAATLSWERGASAGSCAEAAPIQLELEQRLAKPLASLRPEQTVRVEVERRGGAWVARLQVRDERGELQGERTLSVIADDCRKLEQYTVIVLALTLEGGVALDVGASSGPTTLAPEPPEATEPEPAPVARSPRPAEQLPRVSGSGELCLFVEEVVYGPGFASAPAAGAAIRADGRRLRAALAAELGQHPRLTVVEVSPSFSDELSLRSWVRRASELPAPLVTLPAGSELESPAQADYVLVPLIETLSVQDGLDYSLGADPRAIVVNARVQLLGFDFVRRRELRPMALDASLAFSGDARSAAAVRFALQTALEKIAADGVNSVEQELRLAALSQAASAVGARRACTPGRSSAGGTGPLPRARAARWELGLYVDAMKRLAYAEPTDAQLARARAAGLRAQELGPATELGAGVRLSRRALSDAGGWRPGFDVRVATVDTELAPLILELKGGVDYELPLQPAVGLALLPQARGGVLWSSGRLGADDDERGRLETLVSATLSLDLTIALYRVIGDFSPFLTVGGEYVLPPLSPTRKSAFLDSELPRLHGASLALGFLMRGPRANP